MPYSRKSHSTHRKRRERQLLGGRIRAFFSKLRGRSKSDADAARRKSSRGSDTGQGGSPDKLIFFLVVGLCLFGWIMIYSGSFYVASQRTSTLITPNNPFHFFLLQGFWLTASTIAGYITYRINFRCWKYLSIPFLLFVVGGLVLVLLLPQTVNGAKSWILIGPFSFQPSEFSKPALIAFVAALITRMRQYKDVMDYLIHKLLVFLIPTLVVGFLVLLGRDLATSIIIIATAFIMFYFSENSRVHNLVTSVVGLLMGGVALIFAIGEAYRFSRIKTYLQFLLNGEIINPTSTGYQLNQILIAVGSGGFFGYGFGQSRQKYFYLQDTAFSDTIFAVIAEEFGTLGSAIIILAFAIIAFRGLKIAAACKNSYGSMLAFGIVVWLTMQAIVHLGVNVGLFPLTGLTLPFLSYGGSSLLSCMIGVGMLLNVSKEVKLD